MQYLHRESIYLADELFGRCLSRRHHIIMEKIMSSVAQVRQRAERAGLRGQGMLLVLLVLQAQQAGLCRIRQSCAPCSRRNHAARARPCSSLCSVAPRPPVSRLS